MLISGLLLTTNHEVKRVDFESENINEIYEILNCRCFDIVDRKIGSKEYAIYIDDEGLLKDKLTPMGACANANEFLVGNLLIVNNSEDRQNTVSLEHEDYKNISNNFYNLSIDKEITYNTSLGELKIKFKKGEWFIKYEA